MDSVIQNGWDQLIDQYIALVALTLLYYDYTLTFDRERRLFWSWRSFKQWGSILFFLNRYCGILGHAPVFLQKFARHSSTLYLFCKRVHSYHQILAIVMQTIIGLTFVTRTYALYDRSRIVLVGLITPGLAAIAVGGLMISQGEPGMDPELPEGSTGCSAALSWSQSWRLAVAWSTIVIFDLVVVIMTLVKTITINRQSGKDCTLTGILIRDGLVYFGVISLATLSNIILFLYGSEIVRGASTTVTNILASVLVSRLMFNLREPREKSVTTISTSSAPTPMTTMIHVLTTIEDIDGGHSLQISQPQRKFSI